MLNLNRYIKVLFTFLGLFCATAKAETPHKTHVVVAMPFRPNMPLDPHWYTPEYVNYIANLLPAEKYEVSGYFVSLQNIPQFLDDMKALADREKKVCIFNVCDGGEWDGYPGISVLTKFEQHPVKDLVAMTGANAQFIFNSDDKTTMNAHIHQAHLRSLPQTLVQAEMYDKTDLLNAITQAHLDQHWPLFCKLNIGAGALGIGPESICHNMKELGIQMQRMHEAYPQSDLIIQPFLPGPEYTVLVLKNRVYVAVQRDFHNPYNLMLEDYLTGVRKSEEEITYLAAPQHVQDLAVKAIQAIPGKHQYTRVDLRDDPQGKTYVLDINDRPGFGTPSTVKCMLDFHQLSEAKLLQDIVESSFD